jgi:hypothetical protein
MDGSRHCWMGGYCDSNCNRCRRGWHLGHAADGAVVRSGGGLALGPGRSADPLDANDWQDGR